MLRKKKVLTAALCAGGVVLSAVLTAAETTIVSQPFANKTDNLAELVGDKSGAWEGYGSVTNQDVGTGYTKSVGKPIATAKDKLYLSVDGQVTCTAATVENKPATVDMMFQIAKPDEELALPSGENKDDIQIALGVENNGTLKVYCTDKTTAKVDWYSLGNATYKEGEWHRVSFTFDYPKQTCQIRLDGEPLMTEYGYLTSDGTGTANGSWYKLNTTTVQNISSLKVVGSTAIDEVVIKQAESGKVTDVLPALADAKSETGGVPNQWIAEQGVTRAVTEKAPDGSNMTVADKYKAGFNVADGKKLEITKMAVKTEGVELTVPVAQSPDGYKNVIEVKNGETIVQTKDIASGTDTVTAVVPTVQDGKAVKYTYQIKTQTTK